MNPLADMSLDAPSPPPADAPLPGFQTRPRRRILAALGGLRPFGQALSPSADAGENRKKLRMAVLTWAVLYPFVTLLLFVTGPVLAGAPLYLRTLVVSLVMVPSMIWIIQPRLVRIAGRFAAPVREAPADYCF